MTFAQKLDAIVEKNNSLLCPGLDTDINKIPQFLLSEKESLFFFNKRIIDATADLVCCYKANSAFYEAHGARGVEQLAKTCAYLKKFYPQIPIIIDAKRADIGNTNEGYVRYIFHYLKADAVTLHPYLGQEALAPFLNLKDKGLIILCRTSNPGAGEFQDFSVDGKKLYQYVAQKVVEQWNKNNNCLLVVGATYPQEMKEIRSIAKDMTFLVPGIGAQGGDLENTLKNGLRKDKKGLLISSTRGILYASDGEDFAEKAREAARKLRDEINNYR